MQISKNFTLQEFVPEKIYNYLGDKCLWLLDERLINLVQFFRDHFNVPITINDWHNGGKFNESGYRLPDTKTGAAFSQHKFGRAADLKFEGISDYEEIRKMIIENYHIFKAEGLTTIEADTPTWLHIDIRNTNSSDLLIVPYK